MDSEAVLQTIEANPAIIIPRVSGKLNISQFSMVLYLHNLGKKSTQSNRIVPNITKI